MDIPKSNSFKIWSVSFLPHVLAYSRRKPLYLAEDSLRFLGRHGFCSPSSQWKKKQRNQRGGRTDFRISWNLGFRAYIVVGVRSEILRFRASRFYWFQILGLKAYRFFGFRAYRFLGGGFGALGSSEAPVACPGVRGSWSWRPSRASSRARLGWEDFLVQSSGVTAVYNTRFSIILVVL